MKGAEIQQGIIDLVRTKGGIVAHFPSVKDSKGFYRTPLAADAKGWPDLFCIYRRTIFVFEVKGDGDSTSPEQDRWLAEFANVPGVRVSVITSKDWKNGLVERMLKEAEEW